ncbi:TerB family tellurite resistance protein [Nocardia sp. NPDC050412]|uniref:TerB family tellurite resistance protein n=1 Tax=unclassified Nocardia TaxID=2637762 RepID=UPI00378AE28B
MPFRGHACPGGACYRARDRRSSARTRACAAVDRQGGGEATGADAVQIGIMIGNADGNFDQDETAAVREACQALRVDPQ